MLSSCHKKVASTSGGSNDVMSESHTISDLPNSFFDVTWVHSREEELQNGSKVYRPSDYKVFPPSRHRAKYFFRKDGTCDYVYLSPNDRHEMKVARWTYQQRDKRLVLKDGDKVVCDVVLKCGDDKLEFQ